MVQIGPKTTVGDGDHDNEYNDHDHEDDYDDSHDGVMTDDVLVKVRRQKLLGCLPWVSRSRRRFTIDSRQKTVSYERGRGWGSWRRDPTVTLRVADINTTR